MVLARPSGIQAAKNHEKFAASLLQKATLCVLLKDERNVNNKVWKYWRRISLKFHSGNRWPFFTKPWQLEMHTLLKKTVLPFLFVSKIVFLSYINTHFHYEFLKHSIHILCLLNTKMQFNQGCKLILSWCDPGYAVQLTVGMFSNVQLNFGHSHSSLLHKAVVFTFYLWNSSLIKEKRNKTTTTKRGWVPDTDWMTQVIISRSGYSMAHLCNYLPHPETEQSWLKMGLSWSRAAHLSHQICWFAPGWPGAWGSHGTEVCAHQYWHSWRAAKC